MDIKANLNAEQKAAVEHTDSGLKRSWRVPVVVGSIVLVILGFAATYYFFGRSGSVALTVGAGSYNRGEDIAFQFHNKSRASICLASLLQDGLVRVDANYGDPSFYLERLDGTVWEKVNPPDCTDWIQPLQQASCFFTCDLSAPVPFAYSTNIRSRQSFSFDVATYIKPHQDCSLDWQPEPGTYRLLLNYSDTCSTSQLPDGDSVVHALVSDEFMIQ